MREHSRDRELLEEVQQVTGTLLKTAGLDEDTEIMLELSSEVVKMHIRMCHAVLSR
jgi:hypothetical protein